MQTSRLSRPPPAGVEFGHGQPPADKRSVLVRVHDPGHTGMRPDGPQCGLAPGKPTERAGNSVHPLRRLGTVGRMPGHGGADMALMEKVSHQARPARCPLSDVRRLVRHRRAMPDMRGIIFSGQACQSSPRSAHNTVARITRVFDRPWRRDIVRRWPRICARRRSASHLLWSYRRSAGFGLNLRSRIRNSEIDFVHSFWETARRHASQASGPESRRKV